jgi:bacteriocin biosynthesis cyclodehydratase domain-containing protein
MAEVHFDRLIGLNPQFNVHVVEDRQVLLLSEQRSFRLTGKLYVALVPFLDGTRTGQEIVKAFEGRAPEERLRFAIRNMLEKDYAGYLDAEAPAGRQALWVELGLSPVEAERNLAGRTIAIKSLGANSAAREAGRALRRAAADAGLRVVAQKDADLVVVSVEDYLRRDLEAMNRRMRKAGTPWVLFKAGGSVPLLGPLFRPDSAPCWACLTNRMMENRPGDRLVGKETKAVRAAQAHNRASLSLAANFAALELARALAQGEHPGLEQNIVSLDLKTRLYREHMVRLDPNCPVCGEAYKQPKALELAKRPLVLASRPVLAQVDGGWRVSSAAEVVRRLSRYVSPITGLIAELDDGSPGDGLPVFQAKQTNPVHTSPRANRLVGRPGAAAGKGMGETQAKASCLAEAMERYLCGYTGREGRMRATWSEVESAAPHPYRYLNYSDRQYDGREEWNKNHDGFNWVGERFDEKRNIEWTPAWSLTHDALRWLPTRYCYFNYTDARIRNEEDDNAFCAADSNGCASGSTVEEAILQGFLELIERDACALWWYSRVKRPAFDLDAIEDPFVRRVQAFYKGRGRGLHVLDLTNDFGVPVAISLSYNLSDGKSIVLGLGAHLDADVAVNRALSEMNQMLILETEVAKMGEETAAASTGDDAVMLDWIKNKSLDTEPYCVADGTIRTNAYERPRIHDLKDAVERCMRIVSDKGFEMIALDHSRPEIDFAAARVVVPGMRHFWARFRPGRLYDAPVDLGWLDRPLSEDELNPIPFFL